MAIARMYVNGFLSTSVRRGLKLAEPVAFTNIRSLPVASYVKPPSLIGTLNSFLDGIFLIKRTFQPSVLKRKRQHGFLARVRTRFGRKILNRRHNKGRKELCA